jgi:hypothetical protein
MSLIIVQNCIVLKMLHARKCKSKLLQLLAVPLYNPPINQKLNNNCIQLKKITHCGEKGRSMKSDKKLLFIQQHQN